MSRSSPIVSAREPSGAGPGCTDPALSGGAARQPVAGGPELPTEKLVPVGLPKAYVGAWAAIGVASLAYLSFAVGNPAAVSWQNATTAPMASREGAPSNPESGRAARTEQRSVQDGGQQDPRRGASPAGNLRAAEADTMEAEVKAEVARLPVAVPQPVSDGTPAAAGPRNTHRAVATPKPASGFPERHVTTMEILAGSSGNAAEPARSKEALASQGVHRDRVALPVGAAAPAEGVSAITTGSLIKVPPPPERGPDRPAVSRTALKSATAPQPSARASQTTSARNWPAARTTSADETQAAGTPAVTFGPATVTAATEEAQALGVLLATGSSLQSLRTTWQILTERHALDFHGLSPRYIVRSDADADGRKFALIAGPVSSAVEIARVCSILVAEGLECRTSNFTGNAL